VGPGQESICSYRFYAVLFYLPNCIYYVSGKTLETFPLLLPLRKAKDIPSRFNHPFSNIVEDLDVHSLWALLQLDNIKCKKGHLAVFINVSIINIWGSFASLVLNDLLVTAFLQAKS
jgi:hypothetical protein